MLRIIAGELRGRRIAVPPGKGTRPTADQVREGLFNTLAHMTTLEGARVWDLYAGSGALGIEALSRGAAHVTFVERGGRAVATIRANLASLSIDPERYRSFNMVIADRRTAYWVRHRAQPPKPGERSPEIEAFELPVGLSMLTAHDRNDPESARVRTYLPRFEAAAPPDPRRGTWGAWKRILASRRFDPDDGPQGAMTVVTDSGFETVSSSLIALPGLPQSARAKPAVPVWLFAPGRPDQTTFEEVQI